MIRALAAAGAAAVLAACGSGERGPATQGADAAAFALAVEFDSCDPLDAGATGNAVLQRQILEGLSEFRYVEEASEEVQPLLAASWQSSDDGRTWTFRLRPDARFHDPFDPPLWPGRTRAVTAQDVVDSWLRLADGEEGGDGWWALEGLVEGVDAYHEATAGGGEEAAEARREARAEGIAGLRARDERTVEVRLTRPDPRLPLRIATPHFAVYPREAVDAPDRTLADRPVGSGPFALAAWTPGQSATLRAVPAWRGQPSPFGDGTLPFLEELRFSVVREPTTRREMFENDAIARFVPTQAAFDQYVEDGELRPEARARGIRLHWAETPDLSMLSFGMRDPVIGIVAGDEEGNRRRRELRRALAEAFPHARWHELVRNGVWGEPARSFLPPQLPEADAVPAFPWKEGGPERAAALLAAAGWPEGAGLPPLTLDLAGTGRVSMAIGEAYAATLARIGVELRVQPNPWSRLQEKAAGEEVQLFLNGWSLDWADAANLLEIFHGARIADGVNMTHFADPLFDRAFEAYRQAPSAEERERLAVEMVEILNHEVPAVPLDHRKGVLLVHDWLGNFRLHPFDPYPCKYYRVLPH